MNYINLIVKILEEPQKKFFDKKNGTLNIIAKPTSTRNIDFGQVICLQFWGKCAKEILKYYRKKDYIIIEGYISRNPKNYNEVLNDQNDLIIISVLKFYPLIINL